MARALLSASPPTRADRKRDASSSSPTVAAKGGDDTRARVPVAAEAFAAGEGTDQHVCDWSG
jgi:hypothetical protein